MSTVRSIVLVCTEGSSNKRYALSIVAEGDGYSVRTEHGPRCGTQTPGSKTREPVPLDEATAIFEKTLKSKRAGKYVPVDGDAQSLTVGEPTNRDSGLRPQLLNAIDSSEAEALVFDPQFMAQTKADGERRMIRVADGLPEGINRKGEIVQLPTVIAEAIARRFPGPLTILDGEQINNVFHAFDILAERGRAIDHLPAEERYHLLCEAVGPADAAVCVLQAAITTAEKRALLDHAKENGEEGIVFKHRQARYEPGRPASGGDALKFKFWLSASCRVAAINSGKRSVQIEVHDAGRWTNVGNVTVKANQAFPGVGAIVEVKYLYLASAQGSLFQPELIAVRTDLDDAACCMTQLKVKGQPQASAA
jgi:bifunctional non-homologous end joining protein LigD